MAAALLVTDTRAVTARCMATKSRAWAGEQELCMVCSVMTAALACVTLVLELKEHRSRRRLELLTRGLKSKLRSSLAELTFQVPRSGVGRCAKEVVLRAPTPTSRDPVPYLENGLELK